MANLTIDINDTFKTGELIVHSKETFQNESLSGPRAVEYFSKCASEDFAMYVVAVNPTSGEADVSFEFGLKSFKKGAVFELFLNDDNTGLVAKVEGKFAVKLRAGVEEGLPPGAIFKLQGFCYKGGSYRGFMSYLVDQTDDNVDSWFEIKNAVIK